MPYISVKDLRKIDKYITKQCSMNLVQNMTKEEAEQEIRDYCEIVQIFFKLYDGQKKIADYNREAMRKYRTDPATREKAKEYSREYMRKYNKRR